jgi:hypothetical protein
VAWILGQPKGLLAETSLKAWAKVEERGPSEWVLTLETLQGQDCGERVLQGNSCLEVTRAAALVLAFTIDPKTMMNREQRSEPGPLAAESQTAQESKVPESQSAEQPRSEPATPPRQAENRTPQQATRAQGLSTRPQPPADARSRQEPPTFAVQAHGLSGLGLLPGLAWGVGGALSVRWRGFGLSASGHTWFKRTQWVEGHEGKGGEFGSVGAGATARVALLRRPVVVEALTGAQLDRLRAVGRGVDEPETVKITMLAWVAGTSVTLPLSKHAFASAGVEFAVPITGRRRFVLEDLGLVYQPGEVNGRLVLGGGWAF